MDCVRVSVSVTEYLASHLHDFNVKTVSSRKWPNNNFFVKLLEKNSRKLNSKLRFTKSKTHVYLLATPYFAQKLPCITPKFSRKLCCAASNLTRSCEMEKKGLEKMELKTGV